MTEPWHVFSVVEGLRLHHLDYGGEGPPVVLIHGVLGQAWMWRGVAPALTSHGHVVAVDLRGYGDSQWSLDGADSTSELASDLLGMADLHGWDSATIVGFSLGGLVGLAMSEQRPDFVDRLVMVDLPPASSKTETEVPPIQMAVADHGEAVAAERASIPHASESLIQTMASHGYRPGEQGTLVRKHHPVIAQRWRFRSEDWWGALERFDRPLLFVHAVDGLVCSEEEAHAVVQRSRLGRLVSVPQSGHLVPLEQPEAFSQHVVSFLEDR